MVKIAQMRKPAGLEGRRAEAQPRGWESAAAGAPALREGQASVVPVTALIAVTAMKSLSLPALLGAGITTS